jgi:O-antigen/teichoic acid export membrane protein
MQSSRRSSTAWGAALGYASIALGIGRNIVLVPLYLQFLSPTEYGSWLATGGTLVQLLVSDFGVGGVILQRTAAASGAGDRDRLSIVVGTAWIASLVIAVVVSAAGAAICPFLPRLLDLDPTLGRKITDCFLLSIAANAITVLVTISGNVLRGLQRTIGAGTIQVLGEVAVIVVTVVLLYQGYGLYSLAWGMVARALLAATGNAVLAYRVCVRELRLTPRLHAAESRSLTADSTRLFSVSLCMKLLTRADVFLVGTVLGSESAAVYGITTRLVDTVSILISQLTTALLPAMAHLFGEGSLSRFRDLLMRIAPVLCAVTLASLATAAAINRDFISLWVGQGMFGGSGTTLAFASAAFASCIGFIAYDVLMAAGRFRFIARTFAVFSIVQVPLTLLMVHQFGMVGAPLAGGMSALGWSVVMWGHVPRVLAPEAPDYRRLAGAVGSSAAVVIAIYTVATYFSPGARSWTQLAATALILETLMLGGILFCGRVVRESARVEAFATLRALGRKS